MVTIYQILIAPFGSVRFRDFFFADIITSMGQPLADMGLITAYVNGGNWSINTPLSKIDREASSIVVYLTFMAYLPYWWRFWQCINKWYKHDNRM